MSYVTITGRTSADFDSRNSAHTKSAARSLSPTHTAGPHGTADRSALRRFGPVVGLAVGAGLVFGGPALTVSAADEVPTGSSHPQAAQQASGQVPESQQQQSAADRTYSSPVPAGTGSPTSEFAPPDRPTHVGTDFAVPTGTPVTSVSEGTVLRTTDSDEGGALQHHTGRGVVIDHGEINGDRMYSYYGHLDEVQVEPGDTVDAGAQIGKSGNTGDSTGPHLHLGVFMNSEDPNGAIWDSDSEVGFIDPVAWLDRKGIDAGQDAPVDP